MLRKMCLTQFFNNFEYSNNILIINILQVNTPF